MGELVIEIGKRGMLRWERLRQEREVAEMRSKMIEIGKRGDGDGKVGN